MANREKSKSAKRYRTKRAKPSKLMQTQPIDTVNIKIPESTRSVEELEDDLRREENELANLH